MWKDRFEAGFRLSFFLFRLDSKDAAQFHDPLPQVGDSQFHLVSLLKQLGNVLVFLYQVLGQRLQSLHQLR